jgi:hypothetical protein
MRTAAQSVFVAFFCVFALIFVCVPRAFAQTAPPTYSITSNYTNTEPNVPQDHHTFTQVELIDILSAAMCQLTGVDPADPQQPCLGVDPTTGKIGFAPTQTQQFGMTTNSEPQVGGAVGLMTQYIGSLYVPAVSTSQYVGYLAANFGLTKPVYAATDCNTSNFGYGFCGLNPLLKLWSDVRDLSYAFLTILFIAIGIGVMLRFRVDPRTVMTLQNQIPRVIIAIVLITFSFAIAGALIDVMWTVTYAGINFITQAAPNSQVALCPNPPQPMNTAVETRLVDQPISFTNTVFRADCKGAIDSGLLSLSTKVSEAMGDLAQQLIHDLLFNNPNSCHINWFNPLSVIGGAAKCALQNGALDILLWVTEFLVKLIIVIAILIALFRLWLKLIQCYLTFLIFVILGPIWIVLGLIPGRPLGFEKWLRIIFANLAVFPLVAFILVFARVLTDIVPAGPSTPSTVFVPPLIGNPSIATFSDLMGFGAIMIAPTIPDIIKDRMKAKSQANLGGIAAAGFGAGAAAFTSPGKRAWESLNRKNATTGLPEGALAIQKQNLARKIPGLRRYAIAREQQRREAAGYSSAENGITPLWRAIKNQGGKPDEGGPQAPASAAPKPRPSGGRGSGAPTARPWMDPEAERRAKSRPARQTDNTSSQTSSAAPAGGSAQPSKPQKSGWTRFRIGRGSEQPETDQFLQKVREERVKAGNRPDEPLQPKVKKGKQK